MSIHKQVVDQTNKQPANLRVKYGGVAIHDGVPKEFAVAHSSLGVGADGLLLTFARLAD